MKHLGSFSYWMLFDCSETPEEMLRVAYNIEASTWHHVCDVLECAYDPDPMIPQQVIDIHLSTITKKDDTE